MKITIIKQLNNTLKVAYNSDYELLKKLKPGKEYQCEIKRPRNYMFHKKFFALINMVYENQEKYNNIDDLRDNLTIEAGFYRITHTIQGDEVKKPLSISFASMDQEEFDNLYNRIIDVIFNWLGFDKQDIKDNIEQFF